MKNIKYLLDNSTIPTYENEEIKDIIRKECELHGRNLQLTLCMEEFAELIEVLEDIDIRGRVDMPHLIEELADSMMCIDRIQTLFNITINDNIKQLYDKSKCIQNCILNLSQAIITLSKIIRNKPNDNIKAFNVLHNIIETNHNIIEYYNINTSDALNQIVDIYQLKIQRMSTRIIAEINTKSTIEVNGCYAHDMAITPDEINTEYTTAE